MRVDKFLAAIAVTRRTSIKLGSIPWPKSERVHASCGRASIEQPAKQNKMLQTPGLRKLPEITNRYRTWINISPNPLLHIMRQFAKKTLTYWKEKVCEGFWKSSQYFICLTKISSLLGGALSLVDLIRTSNLRSISQTENCCYVNAATNSLEGSLQFPNIWKLRLSCSLKISNEGQ